MDPNRTALALDGYGIGVSTVRKAPYFAQDLAALCAAYGVKLCGHPFAEPPALYLVTPGKSFAEDHAHLPGVLST